MSRLWFAAIAAGSLLCGAAQAQELDAIQWLERMYSASKHLSYTGTFLYQRGDHIETSRITRLVDEHGVRERLETLDGMPPREVVRDNDEVTCYLPGSMTVKVDSRRETRPFPLVQGERLDDIALHYDVRKGVVDRIAGHEAQAIILDPRDELRYGHRLWADLETGLLLKAKTYNERDEQVEQFTFTHLQIGGPIDQKLVQSRFAGKGGNWRVETSAMAEADLSKQGWRLKALPPGYRKVTELKRRVGEAEGVGHVVVSDGLAAVSVFIEPLQAGKVNRTPMGPSRKGALNIYTRHIDNYLVTVIGEVPADSVHRIADAVEYKPH